MVFKLNRKALNIKQKHYSAVEKQTNNRSLGKTSKIPDDCRSSISVPSHYSVCQKVQSL